MSRIDIRFGAEPVGGSPSAADGATERGTRSIEDLAAAAPLTPAEQRTLLASPTIVMLDPTPTAAAEKFRRLKTKIVNEYKDSAQVIVLTSAAPREGKSLVALNLALAFATDPGDTVLVDADLRRPTVHGHLSPEPKLGLSDVLGGTARMEHALIRLKNSTLRILPGGKAAASPVELLSSDACKALFARLRGEFQRVIVDTPPIVPFTDADVLGAVADGVIIVVRAGSTPASAFKQAVSLVTSTRILGTVFNDVTASLADYGREYHSYHYYHSYYEKSPRE